MKRVSNLSQIKRKRILDFLNALKNKHTDDASIRAITEIENQILDKKYGLVWEVHEETVDDVLRNNIPVFTEDREKKIVSSTDQGYNFIIEGDNLQSLYLLEKTHRGKIDVIYIDPPYNTKNKEFIYDDKKIDATDGFQHSKWLSFMSSRLKIAKNLLKPNGVIAISIGFHEVNSLMFLCQELFQPRQVTCVTVQTSSGNAVANGFTVIQEYIIFITPTDFYPKEVEGDKKANSNPYHGMNLAGFNQTQRPNQAYPIFIDGQGNVVGCGKSLHERINEGSYIGSRSEFVFDYEEAPEGCVAVWPITQDGDPCVWRLIPEVFMQNWNKGYIKILPNKKGRNKYTVQYLSGGIISQIESGTLETVQTDPNKPSLDVVGFKTAASGIPTIWTDKKFLTVAGSKDIKNIFGRKVAFPFPKPVALIKEILMRVSDKNDIVLDFFAGSGTTAQAVLELNREDNGNRHFIICTNNEESICENITYPRVKKIIEGYSFTGKKEEILFEKKLSLKDLEDSQSILSTVQKIKNLNNRKYHRISTSFRDGILKVIGEWDTKEGVEGIPANVKYFKCDWTPRKPEEHLLSNALCLHIREMIELENGFEIDGVSNVLIINKTDFHRYIMDEAIYPHIKNVWVNQNIVFNSLEMEKLDALGFKYIPREYFGQELREAAE